MDPSKFITMHLHSCEIPWVDFDGGTSVRILHARPSEDFVVTQVKAAPGSESQLHRHLGPVFGWTDIGRWGHDRTYEYRPGTYIFETPGVIHKFYAGEQAVEAVFVGYGILEYIDPDSLDVIQSLKPSDVLRHYMEACEKSGVGRPNVLG